MSGALNALREAVAEQLRGAGINAVSAMESARAARWRQAVAAVSLSRVVCAPGGFMDYLGVQTDLSSGKTRELYGREAELTLALDVFAPRDGGESVCQRAAEGIVETLICRGRRGLPPWRSRRAGWNSWRRRGYTARRSAAGARRGWWLRPRRSEGPLWTLK